MAWQLSGFQVVSNGETLSCLIPVRVVPNASRAQIVGWQEDDRLRLKVAAVPEGGRANRAVEKLLAGALGLSVRAVRVEKGETSREKLVRVEGLSMEAVRAATGG